MKKLFLALLVFGLGAFVVACGADTTTTTTKEPTTQGDTTAPRFKNLDPVTGKLPKAEHLKGTTIDLLEGISAIDNITKNPTIEISNKGTYNKDMVGTHVIEYKTTDEAGNSFVANRDIIVHETVVREFKALIINDIAMPYVGVGHEQLRPEKPGDYSLEHAFDFIDASEGAKFRWIDKVYLFPKDNFITQMASAAASGNYANNGGIPFSGYGALGVFDANMKLLYLRVARGTAIEVLSDNTVVSGSAAEFQGVAPAVTGAGLLQNSVRRVESLEGAAYVALVSTPGEYKACGSFIRSTFYTGYETGVANPGQKDVDITTVKGVIKDDYKEETKKPAPLVNPTFTINKNILSFKSIDGALRYEIYVDGVKHEKSIPATAKDTEINFKLSGETALNLVNGTYDIQIKAITKDVFKWSDGELSSVVKYIQIDINDLAAVIISLNGNNINWTSVLGATKYIIYLSVDGLVVNTKVGEVTDTTFDLAPLKQKYANYFSINVVAVGDENHYNSAKSNVVVYSYVEVKALNIDGYQYPVVYTTYTDYFSRRNSPYNLSAGQTGYAGAPYVFYITNFGSYKNNLDAEMEKKVVEAYSVTVLLDGDKKPKSISNVWTNASWTAKSGWAIRPETVKFEGTANNLLGITNILQEEDSLLIFKNANKMSIYNNEGSGKITVDARHLGAYHFVAKDANYDNLDKSTVIKAETPTLDSLVNPKDVVISFADTLYNTLEKPVLSFDSSTGALTWPLVDGVTEYILTLNNKKITLESTVNSYDVSASFPNWIVEGFDAALTAKGDHRNKTSISDKFVQKGEKLTISFVDDIREQVVLINSADEINLLAGVSAKISGEDIIVTVKDDGGFNKTKLGVYVVTYKATVGTVDVKATKTFYVQIEEKTNSVSNIEVKIDDKTFPKAQGYNHESTLKNAGSGATFRGLDRIFVLDTKFYKANVAKHASTHTNNAGVPFLPSGIALILDHEGKIVYGRVLVGPAPLEITKDGVKNATGWNGTASTALGGGGMLKEFEAQIDLFVPNGGYVVLMGSSTTARTFLLSNLLVSGYTSGAVALAQVNINCYGMKMGLKITV